MYFLLSTQPCSRAAVKARKTHQVEPAKEKLRRAKKLGKNYLKTFFIIIKLD